MVLSLAFCGYIHAQTIFIAKGKIEFEKKVNVWKDIDSWSDDGDGDNWLQQIKKTVPQFELSYFNLFFEPQPNFRSFSDGTKQNKEQSECPKNLAGKFQAVQFSVLNDNEK